jgi:molecular chaperone GrpE
MIDDTATPTTEDGGPTASASEALGEVTKQRDEYLEQLQRSRAEFVNYQRRAKVQAEQDRLYAVSGLAIDLLGVLDNLDRAIEAVKASGHPNLVAGIELVSKQFHDALAKHGVEPILALGLPFDPNVHEALMQQPDATKPDHTVVAEMTRGYKLHDRVLRPSRVAVSVRP